MDDLGYTCPQCQSTNKAQANFCRACGFPREVDGALAKHAADGTACPECTRPVRASDRFCLNCGHGLKSQMMAEEGKICYRCSRQLPETARYCFGCGLETTFPPQIAPPATVS
jgi:predicted amidophosphoribosyltransferase